MELDDSGRMLSEALIRAERREQPNIIGFLRELLGEQMSIELSRLAEVANRLKANLEEGVALARSVRPHPRRPLCGCHCAPVGPERLIRCPCLIGRTPAGSHASACSPWE